MVVNRMDLASKIYHPRLRGRVRRVAEGERLTAPLVVDLDPTTFCDLACPGCISGDLLQQGRFGRERLTELAGEIVSAGVEAVILIGGGEPLAHPATAEVIEILAGHGVQVGLVTNGTLIRRNLDVLARGCSWVRVSVDAATPRTYGEMRPARGSANLFAQVIANLELLAERARGAVGFSFVVSSGPLADGAYPGNWTEVAEAARLARSLGCDYIEFKAAMLADHHIAPQPPEVITSLNAQIREAQRHATADFAVELSSSFRALLGSRELEQPKDYSRCAVAELRTLITPSGAYVCPYHRGNPRMRLGDPHSVSLTDLWAGADTSVVDPRKDCRFHCARHTTNRELEAFRPPPDGEDQPYDPFI